MPNDNVPRVPATARRHASPAVLTTLFCGIWLWMVAGLAIAEPRRLGPAMDLADAPMPNTASQASRAAFDRARQGLQRIRSLNQSANARRPAAGRPDGEGNPGPAVRPGNNKPPKRK